MAKKTSSKVRKWIDNFIKSPLVDQKTLLFKPTFAKQLFSGRYGDEYPEEYPSNFQQFYNLRYDREKSECVETTIRFLNFVGIHLTKDQVDLHLEKLPEDDEVLLRKTFYLLRTLARSDETLNISDPFSQNIWDIDFFVRVATRRAQLSIFDSDLPELYNRNGRIPEGYENDEVIRQLFDQIENTNDSFFITGKAGTGKSTFIQYLSQNTTKTVILTAFTGIAAMNVGGMTVHSFFRFPTRPIVPNDPDITVFDDNDPKRKTIESIDTIIIDEISMLRSDLLDAIDFSLRNNGGKPHFPFGGKQILFVGDIFQLPPVTIGGDEIEDILFKEIYNSPYFFDSDAYRKLQPKFFEFTKSHRQKEDQEFLQLLDKVRECNVDEDTLSRLNERYNPDYIPSSTDFVITLTTNNAIANAENQRRLREIDFPSFQFTADSSGSFDEDKTRSNRHLVLKRHAQVIFTRNDPGRRWVNGTIGRIEYIDEEMIEVKLATGEVYSVEKETWEQRGYKYDRDKGKVTSEAKGTFTQYPLKLAWAITIHKSQGLTFDNVVIDLGKGTFVNGQLYTALSRCKRLSGLVLKKKITQADNIHDRRLKDFY